MKIEVNSKRVKWATIGLDLTRHKFVFRFLKGRSYGNQFLFVLPTELIRWTQAVSLILFARGRLLTRTARGGAAGRANVWLCLHLVFFMSSVLPSCTR